jgi:hypothetical protein
MAFRRQKFPGSENETKLHVEVVHLLDVPRRISLKITATDKAVYVRGPDLRLRLGYDTIAYVMSDRGTPFLTDRLELVTHDGANIFVAFPRHDRGLGEVIESRLAGLNVLAVDGEPIGIDSTITYHPWRRDTMSYWEYSWPLPLLESDFLRLRAYAGQEVLRQYSPSTSDLSFERVDDGLGRDWTEPMIALASHRGLPPPALWTAGDHVDQGEHPIIVGVAETDLYLATFETLRSGGVIRRAPHLQTVPFRPIADWELLPQPNGLALMRLMILHDEILNYGSLEEALHVRKDSLEILLLGIADPSKIDVVAEAIIDRVKRHGAYSPGSRSYHPLQRERP